MRTKKSPKAHSLLKRWHLHHLFGSEVSEIAVPEIAARRLYKTLYAEIACRSEPCRNSKSRPQQESL